MSFVVVIPARFASTRLPGKPLLDIAGKPMLQHVYERALLSDARAVYIATDDERIHQAAQRFTNNVCMTLSTHQSGTDRIQEVATQLGLARTICKKIPLPVSPRCMKTSTASKSIAIPTL